MMCHLCTYNSIAICVGLLCYPNITLCGVMLCALMEFDGSVFCLQFTLDSERMIGIISELKVSAEFMSAELFCLGLVQLRFRMVQSQVSW